MTTVAQLKTKILSELAPNSANNSLDTAVSNAIVSAISHYELDRFHFNEDTTAIVTSAGQHIYPFSSSMLGIDSAVIYRSNQRVVPPLIRKTFAFIESRIVSNYQGIPRFYALYKNGLHVADIPDSSMTISLAFHTKLSSLSASGSTSNSWTNEAQELIKVRAKIDVMEGTMRDYEGAARIKYREVEAYYRLQAIYDTFRISGSTDYDL